MNRVIKRSVKQENYEHVLMCLICRSLFDDHDHQPKFLPCHHTFCKECLREYVRQMGDEIECPSCRKVATIPAAGVAALQTNFYAKYIQSLVYGCGAGGDGMLSECECHPNNKLQYLCRDCAHSVCSACLQTEDCKNHKIVPLTTATEEYHQKIDASFASANSLIERKKVQLEALLKALSEEKDESLLKIDSTFEQCVHTLNRRATLLKNKVIDIYNENTTKLDVDLEEISTAMTCIVSLKEYHETMISKGDFTDVEKGIEELDEVCENIKERIQPQKSQILFEDRHGADKFRACVKDLGRVICKSQTVKAVEKPDGEGSSDVVDVGMISPDVMPNKSPEVDEMNPEGGGQAFESLNRESSDGSLKLPDVQTTPGDMCVSPNYVEAVGDTSKCPVPDNAADLRTPKFIGTPQSKQELDRQKVTSHDEIDKSSQLSAGNCVSRAELCISQRPKADFVGHVSSGEQHHQPSPKCGAKAIKGSESMVEPGYWVPTSGSLDAINAEMSSEQTSL